MHLSRTVAGYTDLSFFLISLLCVFHTVTDHIFMQDAESY